MDRINFIAALKNVLPPEHHAQVEPFVIVIDQLHNQKITSAEAIAQLSTAALEQLLATLADRTIQLSEREALVFDSPTIGEAEVVQQIRLLGGVVAGDIIGAQTIIQLHIGRPIGMAEPDPHLFLLQQWILAVLHKHDLAYHPDRQQVAASITACPSWRAVLRSDLPPDVDHLLELLHPLDGDAPAWSELCRIVDLLLPLPYHLTRSTLYDLLRHIVALGLRNLEVSTLYYDWCPPGPDWANRGKSISSLHSIISTFAQADVYFDKKAQRQAHPLVNLALYVAQHAEQQQADPAAVQVLRAWAGTRSTFFGISIPAARPSELREPPDRRLQLRLAPVPTAPADRMRYHLDAWLYIGAQLTPVGQRQEVDRGSLPAVVGNLLEAVGPRLSRSHSPIIELFLPHDLLLLDIDQWLFGDHLLGMNYVLIVRSFERSAKQGWKWWGTWQRKWQLLAHLQDIHEFMWIVSPAEVPSPMRLYGQLKKDQINGVVQTWVPDQADTTIHFIEIVKQIVSAGIVTALFVRPCGHSPLHARTYLEPLLMNLPAQQLAQFTLDHRCEAADDHVHLGAHLTLLWDPPERMPPDVQDDFEAFKADR